MFLYFNFSFMAMTRLVFLLDKFTRNNCSEKEKEELSALVIDPLNEQAIQAYLENAWDELPVEKSMTTKAAASIVDAILQQGDLRKPPVQLSDHTVEFESWKHEELKNGKSLWKKMAVAASVFICIGTAAYLLLNTRSNDTSKTAVSKNKPIEIHTERKPKATITLSGGSVVALDSLASGTLARQGNTAIVKMVNGQIAYSGTGGEAVFNTLTNPRGSSVVHINLSDGSEVWLNAGSSITYPVSFIGNERNVTVNGEAYFEVAHNAKMPFKVRKGSLEITVLGTHFNVNSYDDEKDSKITLLEGLVSVSNDGSKGMIRPGQQAVVDKIVKIASDVDMESVMAWKNGKFQFGEKADINSIMRELSRWYDLDVKFEGNVVGHIGGSISRNADVVKVLNMLEATGTVKFKIDGKKVTVKSNSL